MDLRKQVAEVLEDDCQSNKEAVLDELLEVDVSWPAGAGTERVVRERNPRR